MGPVTGPSSSPLITFLRTAVAQGHDLLARLIASLVVSRRRQFSLALAFAALAGLFASMSVAAASQEGDGTSVCPAPSFDRDRAMVPAGWRIVALPRDLITPDVAPGDVVDVVSQSVVIAAQAVIVTPPTDTTGATVSVAPADAATVATAAQNGDISVVALGSALP